MKNKLTGFASLGLALLGIVAFVVCQNSGWGIEGLFGSENTFLIGVFAALSVVADVIVCIKSFVGKKPDSQQS